MGGFLGMGDKLFAVPWNAIECRPQEGETSTAEQADHVAIVNVSREQLKDSEGFDQDNWPDMANEQWRQINDRPYEARRDRAGATSDPRSDVR